MTQVKKREFQGRAGCAHEGNAAGSPPNRRLDVPGSVALQYPPALLFEPFRLQFDGDEPDDADLLGQVRGDLHHPETDQISCLGKIRCFLEGSGPELTAAAPAGQPQEVMV